VIPTDDDKTRCRRNRVQAVKAIAPQAQLAIVKTRLDRPRLPVPRHTYVISQLKTFLSLDGALANANASAEEPGATMLTCCLTRSQHQVESSNSFSRCCFSFFVADCCLLL
jgi:hypothetical protein